MMMTRVMMMMMMTVMMKIKVCMHLMRHVLSGLKVGRMTGLMMMSDGNSGDDNGGSADYDDCNSDNEDTNICMHLVRHTVNGMKGGRVSGDDYDSGDDDDVR